MLNSEPRTRFAKQIEFKVKELNFIFKMANNSIQIRITVSNEINDLLERAAKKLGKKKSMLSRELMEQKLYDLNLIQKELKEL